LQHNSLTNARDTNYMRIEIQKIADMERALGKTLARNLLAWAKKDGGSLMNKPRWIEFVAVKPEFHLNDGDTLDALAVDLVTGTIQGQRYCGSGDTAINHPEQFDATYKAPQDKGMLFIRAYWNGRNTSWTVTVVSENVPKQIVTK
jgi:hypothetical protein